MGGAAHLHYAIDPWSLRVSDGGAHHLHVASDLSVSLFVDCSVHEHACPQLYCSGNADVTVETTECLHSLCTDVPLNTQIRFRVLPNNGFHDHVVTSPVWLPATETVLTVNDGGAYHGHYPFFFSVSNSCHLHYGALPLNNITDPDFLNSYHEHVAFGDWQIRLIKKPGSKAECSIKLPGIAGGLRTGCHISATTPGIACDVTTTQSGLTSIDATLPVPEATEIRTGVLVDTALPAAETTISAKGVSCRLDAVLPKKITPTIRTGAHVTDVVLPAISGTINAQNTWSKVDATLPAITVTAYTGAGISATLPAISGSISAPSVSVWVHASLPTITAAIRTGARVNAILPGVSCDTTALNISARTDTILPVITPEIRTGVFVSAALPCISNTISASSVSTRFDVSLPSVATAIRAGSHISATLPILVSGIVASTGSVASISVNLPVVTLDLHAYVNNSAEIDITLPAIFPAITAIPGDYSILSASLPSVRADLHALLGALTAIDVTLPPMECALSMYEDINADIDTTLPFPTINAHMWEPDRLEDYLLVYNRLFTDCR